MKFTTTDGLSYAIEDRILCALPDGVPLPFRYVTNLYVGSKSVAFHDESGDIILHIAREVAEIDCDPNARVTGEEGNLVIRTQNSTYEFDQEQRIFRRLAGINPATDPNVLDGDWQPYERIESLKVGWSPLIVYAGPKTGKAKSLSTVREIIGTYIPPPVVADDDHPFGDVTLLPDQV